MKDLWLRTHEDLIDEYLDSHPGLSWGAAYDITAPLVNDRMRDMLAEQIDQARMEAKYGE